MIDLLKLRFDTICRMQKALLWTACELHICWTYWFNKLLFCVADSNRWPLHCDLSSGTELLLFGIEYSQPFGVLSALKLQWITNYHRQTAGQFFENSENETTLLTQKAWKEPSFAILKQHNEQESCLMLGRWLDKIASSQGSVVWRRTLTVLQYNLLPTSLPADHWRPVRLALDHQKQRTQLILNTQLTCSNRFPIALLCSTAMGLCQVWLSVLLTLCQSGHMPTHRMARPLVPCMSSTSVKKETSLCHAGSL